MPSRTEVGRRALRPPTPVTTNRRIDAAEIAALVRTLWSSASPRLREHLLQDARVRAVLNRFDLGGEH